MVRTHHGEEGVDRLFDIAGVKRTEYHTEVVYPESDFQSLYGAALRLYGVDDDTAQKAFSDYFIEISPTLFPAIFKVSGSARGLLERVPLIHKQWPTAASMTEFREKLWIIESGPRHLRYKYDSPNRLCGVLRYVAEGVLRYYREEGSVVEPRCVRRGDPWCEVEVRFGSGV